MQTEHAPDPGTIASLLSSPARRAAALLAVPVALAVAAYARVLDGEFLFDDRESIVANPAIKSLARFLAETRFLGPNRPVTDLTFALNYAAGGLEPWNYHLTNLAIHLGGVVLVFLLTRRAARLAEAGHPDALAVAVAGVFALHPIQTQAVSYVVQRSEALASGLYVATLLLLLGAERHGRSWRGAAAWAGALAAFLLGLGSKQIVITAPVAYVLLCAAVAGTPTAKRELRALRTRLALVAPFAVLAILHAMATLRSVEGRADAGFTVPGLGPWPYLLTQARVVVRYLALLAWPAGQNADWDVVPSRSVLEPAVLASALFLVALAAGAIVLILRGRRTPGAAGGAARLAGLGGIWFFVVLSVTSSVVPVADVMFEHRVYLASWGVFVAAACGVERLVANRGEGARTAAAVLALWGVLAAATWARNAVWESREAFARDGVAKSPGKARVYLSLGALLHAQGRPAEAIPVYEAGLALARATGKAHVEFQLLRNLAASYSLSGRPRDAAAVYRAMLQKGESGERAELVSSLAVALSNAGELDEAERAARRGIELRPSDPFAVQTLGIVLLKRGDNAQALSVLERAERLDPDRAVVQVNLGRALAAVGRAPEACTRWRRALVLPTVDETLRRKASELLERNCR